MIATEAGAEGINLQFCSLVINYDLPWNPQRVEQRIGRSHRYRQKHDVVVINFLNERNAADQRSTRITNSPFSSIILAGVSQNPGIRFHLRWSSSKHIQA